MRALVFFLLALLSSSLFAQAPAQVQPTVTISVADRVSVTVVGFKEYTGLYDVSSDGTISGPGFGIAKVEGKSLAQATELLTSKFKLIILDPKVYVGLAAERPKVVYLIGIPITPAATSASVPKVADFTKLPQGAVALLPETTVRTLLAGSTFGDRPDQFEGLVVRNGETIKQFDVDRLLKGIDTEFDGPLEPNDVIIIRPKARVKIWLIGPFKQPGDHLVPEGISLDQAISGAGGIDPTQLPQALDLGGVNVLGHAHIQLIRGGEVKRLSALAGSPDLSIPVEAGDTLTLILPRSINITVAGYVMKPSEVSVDEEAGALTAISKAGGPDPHGGLSDVLLYRGNEMYHLDLSPGVPIASQLPLEPNDVVYVNENHRSVQVLGSARLPGVIYLPEDKREFRVSEALAKAGGIGPEGSLRRAVVVRRDANGKFRVYRQFNLDEFLKDGKVAANPVLEPGDVVYFGTPKGMSTNSAILIVTQVINSAAVLYSFGIRF